MCLMIFLAAQLTDLPFKLLGSGVQFQEPVRAVVRTADDWAALFQSYTVPTDLPMLDHPPPVPEGVDLESGMLIIIGLGRTGDAGPEGNASVTIDWIRSSGDSLLVGFTVFQPQPGLYSTLGGSIYPSCMAVVPLAGGEPVFMPGNAD